MKRLIVNADDFGLTRGVNRGIVRAHREGIVTGATIMANGDAFDDAVELARANPSLGVGVHIVLVWGRALAPREKLGYLVDSQGRLPASLSWLFSKINVHLIRRRQIQNEIRAQIERVLNAGIKPTHLDTHKHAHCNFWILESLVPVAAEYGITKIRMPFEDIRGAFRPAGGGGLRWISRRAFVLLSRISYPAFRYYMRKNHIQTPEHFFGFVVTGQLKRDGILQILRDLPEGASELVCHPGIFDDDLKQQGTRLLSQRETELGALTDPFVLREIQAREIHLISYRELN